MYLPLQSVHGPPQVPQEYLDRCNITDPERKLYAGRFNIHIIIVTDVYQTPLKFNKKVTDDFPIFN